MLLIVDVLKTCDDVNDAGNDNHVDAMHPLREFVICVFEKTSATDVPARYVARYTLEAGDLSFVRNSTRGRREFCGASNFRKCRVEQLCALTQQ